MTPEREAAFWEKVAIGRHDECWLWLASTNPDGYGYFWDGQQMRPAHRIAWMLGTSTPLRHMCVCHRCDNPACCNPAHFFIGTRRDNNRDRDAKGRTRYASGESNGNAKLTPSAVLEIRRLVSKGEKLRAIGKRFGVDLTAISMIKRGLTWRHVA